MTPEARQAFQRLQQTVSLLESSVAQKSAELGLKDQIINLLKEEIRLLHIRLFGPKTEKLSPEQIQLLVVEPVVTEPEVSAEADLSEAQKATPLPKAKREPSRRPGREVLPEHLERREVIIPVPADQRQCDKCGAERPVIGYEVREELDCEPAKYFVKVIKREKLGSHCVEEQGVATAPVPSQIVPKGKFSDRFIIDVLEKKFQLHQPVYRQCAELLENHKIDLSRQTLTEAILAAGQLLVPVVGAQAAQLVASGYLQADETRVPCQVDEKKGKNHTAWLYQYSQPGGPVVFEFSMHRSREGPKAFFKNFKGKLQTDAYSVYDDLGQAIIHVGCWGHVRRKFIDTLKAAPNTPPAAEMLQRIGALYMVERQARQVAMDAAGRLQLRQDKSAALVAQIQKRLIEIRQATPPGERLAKACNYAINQWTRLEEFLKDGQLEIDNNWCYAARSITPVMPPPDLCRVAA